MTTELEFSEVYKILNSIKQGDETKKDLLDSILIDFKEGDKAESFLHQLGQIYLYIGIEELFKYVNSKNIKFIGQITKEEWDTLAKEKNCDLPIHLANSMIAFLEDKKLSYKLSAKWNIPKREVDKHIMPMARYITEGIIDVLE
ncbi:MULTISPECIES: hypothetical protein [unclassified Prochlorococcus]|uniref:hypothetical protein n=1 Tax=unclassified Prochlorococcus TaxID=2627481 RepID=UPI000533B6D4|nr:MULTISPECIES: hypothetical protein [unclassified Prochlorococcus]KGG16132.1 hypothetical protein EV06_0842 [Prochlorococcus sp. MIT 0602]KGG17250.1 hypothetical protein EV07_0688 [Prochlorococcus sp. MIT 0603]